MTENEAKIKWCPYSRVMEFDKNGEPSTNLPPHNTYASITGIVAKPAGTLCIASGCMAWRWSRSIVEIRTNEPEKRPGYCGLAGVPGA